MTETVNSLNMQVNIIWFVLIFMIFGVLIWMKVFSKKLNEVTKHLENLENANVINEAKLNLQKRRKK